MSKDNEGGMQRLPKSIGFEYSLRLWWKDGAGSGFQKRGMQGSVVAICFYIGVFEPDVLRDFFCFENVAEGKK